MKVKVDLKDISSVSKMSAFQELFALRQKKLAGKYSSPKSMALADTENAFLEKSLVKSVSNNEHCWRESLQKTRHTKFQ